MMFLMQIFNNLDLYIVVIKLLILNSPMWNHY